MRLARILSFLLMVTASSTLAQNLPNPFILQRADPWILRHSDGYYYFIATTPRYERIELRRATTLADLPQVEPIDIWAKHPSGPMGTHIWAPELHAIQGKWYVYFAAGDATDIWKIRIYVLECASPNPLDGPWIEKGQIKTGWDDFSLDATTFEHLGERYLIWAQKGINPNNSSNLYISKMDTPWSLTGPTTCITRPEFDWETQRHAVNEGPAVIKRNGRIFMTYSASATNDKYCIGLLWADEHADLLSRESWSKSPSPVFASSEENGIYGPGHNSFTTDENGQDLLVYHARNYKELSQDPLRDWNRHTRVQSFDWTASGFPDFGKPINETIAPVAPKPLYRDPIFDGAADPVVIWNEKRGRWWMFYTNRRAKAKNLSGVAWVHGTAIGIAESADQGASWKRLAQASITLPAALKIDAPTYWAPEVIRGPEGIYHMYLTFVPGVFENWNHPRNIVHLTSDNLQDWTYQNTLDLASDRVIDACVLPLPNGNWRMWYNNERDAKAIYYADSPDLYQWTDQGKAISDKSGEGPKVVFWKDSYWMATDVWEGLAVYRSDNAKDWIRQSGNNLLQIPGKGVDDGVTGGHPDIVLQGDKAYLFYFTHPGRMEGNQSAPEYEERRSSIQVVELKHENRKLSAERDKATRIKLDPKHSP